MRRALLALLLAVGALLAAPAGVAPAGAAPAAVATAGPCGQPVARPAAYDAVVEVWLENRSYDRVVGAPGWPALTRTARSCVLATAFSGATHPSLPNYLAAASGATGGVRSDCLPATCPQHRSSVFGELTRAGRAWATYAGSAPQPCARVPAGRYAPKHVAALYFPDAAGACGRSVLPLSALRPDRLPALSVVVPDLCDDGHDCADRVADGATARLLSRLVATSAYRAGRVLVLVVFDEGNGGVAGEDCTARRLAADCHVPLVALAAGAPAGRRTAVRADSRALARLVEDALALPGHLPATRRLPALRAALGV